MLCKYKYDIPYSKTENCVLISAREWLRSNQSVLETGDRITNIQKVLDVGYTEVFKTHKLNEGDTIIISKASSKIAYLRPFEIPNNVGKFANVHWMQVLGKVTSLESSSIELFYNKVLLKEINNIQTSQLITEEDNTIFEVINVGPHGFNSKWEEIPLEVKKGMYVFVNKNNCTPVELTDGIFYIIEDTSLLGYFNDTSFTLENFTPFDERITLEEYQEEMNGSLYNPLVDLEVEDISEVYNRDIFRVINTGKNIKSVKQGDIININRDVLSSLKYKFKKYYMINGDEYIRGKYVF